MLIWPPLQRSWHLPYHFWLSVLRFLSQAAPLPPILSLECQPAIHSSLCVFPLSPLQFLYSLGARRFLVVKTQALGCVPYVRSFYPKPFPSHCVQLANALGISNNFFYARALGRVRRSYSDADIFEFKWYELWQAVYVRPQAFGE